MTISRAEFRNTYNPALMKVASDNFKKVPEDWRKLVMVKNSDSEYEEIGFMSGLGLPALKPEGTAITYDKPIDGFTKKFVHRTKGLGCRITMEALRFDKYGNMKALMKQLGLSAAEGINLDVFSILNLGDNASYFTSGDSKAVFATDHVRLDGSSYSNKFTATSLSVDAIQDDILAIESLKDHRGKTINRKDSVAYVVANPANEWKLKEIFGSQYNVDMVGGSGGGNQMTINSLSTTRKIKPLVTPYVTSTSKRYYIGEPDDVRGILYFTAMPVTLAQGEDFDTGDIKYRMIYMNSIGCCDPMNIAQNG